MTEIIKDKRENLEKVAAQIIKEAIQELLKIKEKVVLAVPGGRSVAGIFENLLTEQIPWQKVHIFMIDERLVTVTDKESNFKLAKDTFIDRLETRGQLPMSNIHPFMIDESSDDYGISDYTEELKSVGARYDIILLSSGEDGHIGALYPNHNSIKSESDYYIYMNDSPKPPKGRMSASKNLLLKSKAAIIVLFGDEKRDALNNLLDKKLDIIDCPAKIIDEIENSYILTDLK